MIGSISSINPIASKLEITTKENKAADFQEALEHATKEQDDKALREACEEVETYMLSTIFKQMKASTDMGERLVPKGDYEEQFEDFLIDEQCKIMTKSGGIGLADMMYKQMSIEYSK